MDIDMLKAEVKRLVQRGATEFAVVDGVRRLSFPDGRVALELPSADADLDSSIARYALEQIAKREYAECEGKVVLVTWLSGYDENDCSRDIHFDKPIRVSVDRNINSEDLYRWMDEDHLDPVWNIELVDKDEPVLVGMRSCWLYATSRSLSGKIEKSDIVAVESAMARVARVMGFSKTDPDNPALRI